MKVKRKDYLFVTIQFVLFFCFIFDLNWSLKLFFWIQITGLFIAILGGIIILLALLQLNKNLSPFPTQKESATLIETGLYKFIRHPIYLGIILLTFGIAFYLDSSYKLILSFILLILFFLKTQFEEKQLEINYSNYLEYKLKTGRFFPKL